MLLKRNFYVTTINGKALHLLQKRNCKNESNENVTLFTVWVDTSLTEPWSFHVGNWDSSDSRYHTESRGSWVQIPRPAGIPRPPSSFLPMTLLGVGGWGGGDGKGRPLSGSPAGASGNARSAWLTLLSTFAQAAPACREHSASRKH